MRKEDPLTVALWIMENEGEGEKELTYTEYQ